MTRPSSDAELIARHIAELRKDARGRREVAAGMMNEDGERAQLSEADRLDRLASHLEALTTARDDGWQPIETAPRDGTWVLLCEYSGNPDIRSDYYAGAYAGGKDGYWMAACGQYVTETPQPTHWRMLPEPPRIGR